MAIGNDIRPFPNLEKAYRDYAEALGKPPESLSTEERQQAVMNAILENADDENG